MFTRPLRPTGEVRPDDGEIGIFRHLAARWCGPPCIPTRRQGFTLVRIAKLRHDGAGTGGYLGSASAALTVLTREQAPLDWGTIQSNLGNTLSTLGERESGTARLEEAVVAYRAALTVLTREQAPLDSATTQNRLGEVLYILGERENRTALLEEAVAVWEACLTVAATDWPQGWVQYVRSRISATRVRIAQQTTR